ncbi:MAG: MogA/MoaB family molybdenum cofactor biosynthesis protein [Spirochaetia bacterium]
MTVCVITISDRASRGQYEDRSGPEIVSILREALNDSEIRREVVPDEIQAISDAFDRHTDADFILTTGGTGISSRDVTPEATRSYCEWELPGIAEILRAESYRETPTAVLSRGIAGIRGNTIIVNFPGSVKAVRLCTGVLIPIMEHALSMLRGEGH